MSENNNSKNVLGCILIIVCMGASVLICKPVINILGDGAYPIIVIVGVLLAKFLSKVLFKENDK
jgi:multidrug transporter EmrE-like cation transporter